MKTSRPTYEELERRLAIAEPIVEALKHQEVDAVVGEEKIAFLLLLGVGNTLVTSEAEFRAMFNLGGIGMIQADTPSLRFTRVNQKFCKITGYSAEELETQSYLGLTHPEDRQSAMKELTHVLRGTTDSWSIENRCIRKDGTVIRVEVHGAALRDASGRTLKILAMIRDLGEPGAPGSHTKSGLGVPAHRASTPPKDGPARPPLKSARKAASE